MAKKKKKQQPEKTLPYSFSDEATENKIKKHIKDSKDVITEEDIANAKVPGKEGTPPEETKDENKTDTPGEGKPITPWDIVN